MAAAAQSDQGAVFGPFPVITTDTTTGLEFAAPFQAYDGPVPGLLSQYSVPATGDSYNVVVSTPDIFVLGGSGNDGLTVLNGNNILDGGTGSNFLIGTTTGTDTFYLDGRGPSGTPPTWSTLVNLHAGDAATLWGVTPQDFTVTWLASAGAAGAMGLTGVWQGTGKELGLTLTGYTQADLTNGHLALSYGTTQMTGGVPGSAYLHIAAA